MTLRVFEDLFRKNSGVIRPGLERVRRIAEKSGLLEDLPPVILVAGTNGKGTTSGYLYQLLSAVNYKVGLYTSPHLVNFSERIQVSDEKIDDIKLEIFFLQFKRQLGDEQFNELTFFEIATLLALFVFKALKCDAIVCEVGMGGRLDATNILNPVISVITSIALDHQSYLGNTADEIALEKAGILRPSRVAIFSRPKFYEENSWNLITSAASELKCLISTVEADVNTDHKMLKINVAYLNPVEVPFKNPLPEHLLANFSMAVLAFYHYTGSKTELKTAVENISTAEKPFSLLGRFDRRTIAIQDHTSDFIFDVCHNTQGAVALGAALHDTSESTEIPLPYPGLVTILNDKDILGILAVLSQFLKPIMLYKIASERTFTPEQTKILQEHYQVFENFAAAFDFLESEHEENKPRVVCGSVAGVGEAFASLGLLLIVLFFVWCFHSQLTFAQSEATLPQFFFDAKSSSATKDGKKQIFEGDVIAIGPKSAFSADTIYVDQNLGKIEAIGQAVIIIGQQVYTGQHLEYYLKTGDLKITQGIFVVNDPIAINAISQKILGFSTQEMAFEADRAAQLIAIQGHKSDLENRSRYLQKQGRELPSDLVTDFALLLNREKLISEQKSPEIMRLQDDRRKNILNRRKYWNDVRGQKAVDKAAMEKSIYFKLAGETLERTNGNNFTARNSLWTPCFCAADESPAWSFRASETFAQVGGYATLYNPVLEIKGIPVLYLPIMKIPIKDQRQSGFLMPTMSQRNSTGFIYSQPLFLDLGENKDVTVKTDVFEKRGTRLGTEWRYQQRENSGFQLNVEALRDRVWAEQKTFREDYRDPYINGLAVARTDDSGADSKSLSQLSGLNFDSARLRQKSYWLAQDDASKRCVNGSASEQADCDTLLDKRLSPPANMTRGVIRWSGNSFMANRLSLVSQGDILSDRHYISDLYIPDGVASINDVGRAEAPYNTMQNKIHYDGKNYYLGVGSYLGDHVRLNETYKGNQLPFHGIFSTRWANLTPQKFNFLPIYARVSSDWYRIVNRSGKIKDFDTQASTLGSGHWQRLQADVTAPILTESAINMDFFSNLQSRRILSEGSTQTQTSIASYNTGLRFGLPIDGKMHLSTSKDSGGNDRENVLHHVMNWNIDFVVRPMVQRTGEYGSIDSLGIPSQTYFATDTRGTDTAIDPTQYLDPYQIITFRTSHRWKTFTRGLNILAKSDKNNSLTEIKPTFEELARRELLRVQDQPVRSFADILNEDRSKWFVNRYQLLETDYLEPVYTKANISYDKLKADRRLSDGPTSQNESWSLLESESGVNLMGWSASNLTRYNIYARGNTLVKFTLGLPSFFKTNVIYSHIIDSALQKDSQDNYLFTRTTTREVAFATTLTDPILLAYKYGRRNIEDNVSQPQYSQKLDLIYRSPAKCWTLNFSREKPYDQPELNASYLLELSVIFMGQGTGLGNFSAPAVREINNRSSNQG